MTLFWLSSRYWCLLELRKILPIVLILWLPWTVPFWSQYSWCWHQFFRCQYKSLFAVKPYLFCWRHFEVQFSDFYRNFWIPELDYIYQQSQRFYWEWSCRYLPVFGLLSLSPQLIYNPPKRFEAYFLFTSLFFFSKDSNFQWWSLERGLLFRCSEEL